MFLICSGGRYILTVSSLKALLDSIPVEHRPAIDTSQVGQAVGTFFDDIKPIGTTLVPIIFKNADTKEKFRIVLHAIVVPKLVTPMFIGASSGCLIRSRSYGPDGVEYHFNFSDDEKEDIRVEGF